MSIMSERKIAISGTIGSGKSTVLNYLKTKGYKVFSCDEYNAFLLKEGNEGYLKVRETFPEVFNNNELDKKKLSSIIFNSETQKNKLENIMHPLIIKEMLRQIQENDFIICEVPLLFEQNLEKYFDVSILVVCDEQAAIERLRNRGFNESQAKERIRNQLSVSEKKQRADEIIYNNRSLEDLYLQVDKVINKYAGQRFI